MSAKRILRHNTFLAQGTEKKDFGVPGIISTYCLDKDNKKTAFS